MYLYCITRSSKKELEKENIGTEIFQLGNKPIAGCIGCAVCRNTGGML